ncbi:unnamed protein product [Vitrella brassicaformis CCMP3155]|uniref:Uncharacterized protein n=1 Tax=Vitrella brassicaformis (strain CCMP3155) TaxID=1169540 RepID=A0A0G4H225_VITBC|nr:unnamed protein product [Vitrella brassicaformis CCMP3155]|eukprot:CEM37690.1 unnamed protein product [Vitrella brassicaformis CCMP3155]
MPLHVPRALSPRDVNGGDAVYINVSMLMLAMLLNLYHYFSLLSLIFRSALSQVAENKDALTFRPIFVLTAFSSLLSLREAPVLASSVLYCKSIALCLSRLKRQLLEWHTGREEQRRMRLGKVWLDWNTGKFSLMEPPATDNMSHNTASSPEIVIHGKKQHDRLSGVVRFAKSRAEEWWIARKRELVMRMLTAAMQEAVDLLQIKEVPPDFLDFLWSYCFVLHSPYMKKETERREFERIWRDEPWDVAIQERPVIQSSYSHLCQQSTMETRRGSVWVRDLAESDKSFVASERSAADCAKSGMTLHDLQSKLLLVVDKLVTFQNMYEENIHLSKRTRSPKVRSPSGRNVAKEDKSFVQSVTGTDDVLETHEHIGGWRELYAAYKNAKQKKRHGRPRSTSAQTYELEHEGGVDVERLMTGVERMIAAHVSEGVSEGVLGEGQLDENEQGLSYGEGHT